MVKWLCVKKGFWLAITLFVIANLSLGSRIFAKQLEIKAEDVDKIKTVLGIAQTIANISDLVIHNKDLLTILNTVIGSGKAGADVTYGLLVLSALNEMDLIDLVISQDYKDEAREYFEQVLGERTNLGSYWRGIGYDLPKIVLGQITGPIAALTLNTFAITDKAIAIFVGFDVLEKMKLYDGLWYYFDTRKQGNEPHKITWEETKEVLGFATNSLGGLYRDNGRDKKIANLEQQFLSLYENWEPYLTPFGISEKYKKQVKEELGSTLITAVKENAALTKNEPKLSIIDKLTQQLERLKEATAALITKINPFKAGVALNLPEESTELVEELPETELKEVGLPLIDPMIEVPPQSIEPLEEVKIIEEDVREEIIEPEVEEIIATTTVPEVLASTTEPALELELEPEPLALMVESAPAPGPVFCERDSGNPARFRVLINEIAWMGTTNSTDDEWIELKNVWGIPVNLNGWQLLDKDRQIKIIFGEEDIIPAGGYYLLERTDDNSMPDVEADLIYTGALSNTNEALYLFDSDCRLEDEVLANPNWPAGDNSLKKPMERLDVLYWYTGVSTPGSENGSPSVIRSPVVTPISSQITSLISPQIFITETYIGSESNQKDDFVELYNPNSEAIDLTDYYLQRKTENAQDFSTYVSHELLAGKTIVARNYFLIANASSTFATSADVVTTYPLTENNTLVLKDPKQEIIDQVSTDNPAVGKSYGRKWSNVTLNYTEDFEAQTPTPRAQNQNSAAEDDGGGGESLSVVINEIAWAGTAANHFDEWIELFANSTTSFAGWKILGSKNGTTTLEIPLSGFASSSTYILIERTDNNTIFDLSANLFFTGNLDNDGMKLELRNSNNGLVDSVDCSSGWFAGDNSTKQTMERINPLAGSDLANWASNNLVTKNGLDADGNPINGTPKNENSVAKDFTVLSGGITFSENFTLRRLGSPYISDGPIHVLSGVMLSIEPGVIIKLKHGSSRTPYAELKVEGFLETLGGSEHAQKIVFTSYKDDEYGGDTNNDGATTQPATGDWDWVYFKDSVSNLQNVIVRYGGKLHSSCCGEFTSYTYGAIYIDGGQLTISSSTIETSATLGIWINNSSTTQISGTEFKNIDTSWSKPAAIYIESSAPTIKNSTFNNNNIGILIENSANPVIENNVFENNQTPIKTSNLLTSFSNNTAQNNTLNGILVSGLGFSETVSEITWRKTNLPYILESSATVSSGKILNIEAGVVIKLKGGGRFYVDGALAARGTQAEKIIFTSLDQETAGSWHFIKFSASSINSIFDNVIVRYGGWYNVAQGGIGAKSGAVKVDGTNLIIKNSLFENNLYAGLELVNSTTTLENTAFNKNEHGIYVGAGDCPNLSGATFGTGANANLVNVFPSRCAP